MGGLDKIFIDLAGKPLLAHSVDVFQGIDAISRIIIVLRDQNLDRGRQMVEERGWSKVIEVCPGGRLRQDSIKEGLNRLTDCEWVAIHDGARPLVTEKLVLDGLNAARSSGAAIPAIPVSDTIKKVDDSLVIETIPRAQLWAVQTPQIFRFDIISEAYDKIKSDVTDDASMVESLGYKVKVFPGDSTNIKVTNPHDITIAEAILANRMLA